MTHHGLLLSGAYSSVREMAESDAPRIVEWRNRPEVQRWVYQWEPLTLDRQRRWQSAAKERGDLLFVFETLAGEPVGTGSVYNFEQRLGNAARWGRLFASSPSRSPRALVEACYLVHRVCFEVLGLRRLFSEVVSENRVSRRLAEFLGYEEEGVQRRHWRHPSGILEDVILLGLFSQEFEKQRTTIEQTLYRGQAGAEITAERAASIRRALGWGAPGSASHGPPRRSA